MFGIKLCWHDYEVISHNLTDEEVEEFNKLHGNIDFTRGRSFIDSVYCYVVVDGIPYKDFLCLKCGKEKRLMTNKTRLILKQAKESTARNKERKEKAKNMLLLKEVKEVGARVRARCDRNF